MSLLLNGLTDKALLGLDLFIFSKALIWAFSFYDSCKQTGDIKWQSKLQFIWARLYKYKKRNNKNYLLVLIQCSSNRAKP